MTQMLEQAGGDTLSRIDETLAAVEGLPVDQQVGETGPYAGDPMNGYAYSVTYDAIGNIATSTVVEPRNESVTTINYNEAGKETGTRTIQPGYEAYSVDGVIRYKRISEDDGDYVTQRWYDGNEALTRSVIVNKKDNTLTMQFVQNGTYGPVEKVTQYEGTDGWVGAVPAALVPPQQKKK